MINLFLKAKHWQLFLVSYGLPVLFQSSISSSMVEELKENPNPDLTLIFDYLSLIPLIMLVYLIFFYGWYWSVAIGLQRYVPENVTMKVTKFKIFFLSAQVYAIAIVGTMLFAAGVYKGYIDFDWIKYLPAEETIWKIVGVIVVLHLYSIFCMLYSMYFVAKTYKTVMLQREVKFSDFAGEFFLIWFYPIGVWVVQPHINKMVETQPETV